MVAHKLAYDSQPPKDASIVFRGLAGTEFAAIGASEHGIAVDRSRLRLPRARKPFWPDLSSAIDYGSHDGFIVVAPLRTSDVLRAHRLIAARNTSYTAHYLRAMATGIVEADHGLRLTGEIVRRSHKPVIFVAAPLPALSPKETVEAPAPPYRDAMQLLQAACRDQGARLVPQPEPTLENFERTRLEFAVGSVAYDGRAHPRDERVHMNAAYGALVLEAVLSAVRGAAAEARTRSEEVDDPSREPSRDPGRDPNRSASV